MIDVSLEKDQNVFKMRTGCFGKKLFEGYSVRVIEYTFPLTNEHKQKRKAEPS